MKQKRTYQKPFVSSDVLSQNRVNVSEEKSERVIWYKVRATLCSVHVSHAKPVAGEIPDG